MALTLGRLVKAGTNDGSSQNIVDASWAIKTGACAVAAGDRILADSSGGAFVVTLPASPAAADEIEICDPSGSWAAHNLTVGRNGKNIESRGADLILNVARAHLRLIFVGATVGWAIRQVC